MAYCTTADIKDGFPLDSLIQITDDESLGTINQPRIDKAIAAGDTLIDSYLKGKQDVPFSPVPVRIRQLSVDLAIFFLYKRRRQMEMPKDIQTDYDRNIRFLESVRDGKTLLDTPTAVNNTAAIFHTNKKSSDRIYTSDTLKGF